MPLSVTTPSTLLREKSSPAIDRVQTWQRLLMLVALYAIPVVVCVQSGVDWDLWWHLRTGQWVVEHGTVPSHDPFSAFGQSQPWVAYSWLFEVLVYGLYQAFGLYAPIIYQAALALAVVAAVHRLIARREQRFLVATMLTGAAVLALAALFKQRPWLFTILFSTLTLDVVLDLRAGRDNRLTWWLPFIFVLWANVHIQFIYGLFILGLACIAPLFDRYLFLRDEKAPMRLILLTVLCTLATLVNPYHVRLYFVVLEYASQPGPFRFVNELRALEFREITDWVMLGLAAAATFSLGRRRRLSSFDMLLLAAAAFFAFRARRDLWFLVLASAAVLAERSSDIVAVSERFTFSWLRAAFVGGAIALLIPTVGVARHLSNDELQRAVAKVFPADAVRMVRERHYAGPLFNDFDWGGYLIWSMPDYPVVVDGRTNLHGDARLERIGATWAGAAEWRDDPDLAHAGLVIANSTMPLANLLSDDPRFELVYQDERAKVFVKRTNQSP